MTVVDQDAGSSAAVDVRRGGLPGPIAFLSSMKLSVVLLVLLAILTFLGTLAQKDQGLYFVQKEYFESWFVFPRLFGFLVLPLPGAVPVLALLFLNLLVGGLVRLRWSARNFGILVTHCGIALLLLSGFVKLSMSDAGHMFLYEGETGSRIISPHDWELALMRQDGDEVVERVVPGDVLEAAVGGRRVRLPGEGLPFSVEVHHFLPHCRPTRVGPRFEPRAPVVDGVFLGAAPQFIWAASDREMQLPGCYVTVVDSAGGDSRQAILWADDRLGGGRDLQPFTFESGGQTWGLELRHKTWNSPFSLRLDRFKKTDHPGTMTPRDYSSWVTVLEPEKQPRPVHIYMNEPLRKDGLIFFQSNWGPQPPRSGPPWYSVFEVARNPSDQWPLWASLVILAGLVIHFGAKLLKYIGRESRRREVEGA